jgi:uncharacterized membrane protein YccC
VEVASLASIRTSARSPLLQVLKTSVAAIVAWYLSVLLLGQQLPIFAAIAALLVVQPSVNQSLSKGIERSIGVVVGVVVAYGAGLLFGSSSWVVLAIILVSLLLAWALKLTPGSSNQIPISAMLVLALGTQTPKYAFDRVLETVIGAVAGLIVNAVIVPPVLVAPATGAVGRLAGSIAEALEGLASALRGPTSTNALDDLLQRARTLRPSQVSAESALAAAEESLTFNPRGGRHRPSLDRNRAVLERLTILVTRTVGMTRAVHDNYDVELGHDAVVMSIAVELDRAAHDVRLLVSDTAADDVDRPADELPALTAPLVISRPDPRHWILVGSLMEDLRRVREEIIGRQEG